MSPIVHQCGNSVATLPMTHATSEIASGDIEVSDLYLSVCEFVQRGNVAAGGLCSGASIDFMGQECSAFTEE